jgi:hypothetical protein
MTTKTVSKSTRKAQQHAAWCDTAVHRQDVKSSGGDMGCVSAWANIVPGWPADGSNTSAWLTTQDDGRVTVFVDTPPAEGTSGISLTPGEAEVLGRLLREGSVEQLRTFGQGLGQLAQRYFDDAWSRQR